MAVETPEDRLIFVDPTAFGVEGGALYAPRDGQTPYVVDGIFDQPTHEFNPNQWPGHPYQMQEGAHFVVSGPTFTCRASDLVKGGKRRDRLTVEGVAWVVAKAMPDGTGMTVLHLSDDEEDPIEAETDALRGEEP